MHKYIIMGVQGCGKGTQAKMLAQDFDLVHMSVGDIFRWHIQRHTKLGARIRWKGAPDFIMRRAEVLLDGNSIWDSGDKPMVDEMIKVSERPIKPGTHSVAIRLEIRPGKKSEKEHEGLGYELEHTFVINVPDGKRTTIDITADDDGDLPEYEPEIEVEVESEK